MSTALYLSGQSGAITVYQREFDGIEGPRHYPVHRLVSRAETQKLIDALRAEIEHCFPQPAPRPAALWLWSEAHP